MCNKDAHFGEMIQRLKLQLQPFLATNFIATKSAHAWHVDEITRICEVDEDINAAVFYSDGVRISELSNHLLFVMVDQMRHHHKWNGVLV